MYVNSVVVVGDRFDPGMFEPAKQFFDGAVDPGQMLVGPIAQVGFKGGQCGFALNPNRIDLTVRSGHEVMPKELWDAGRVLVRTLGKIRIAVKINGLGLNCDTVLLAPEKGMDAVKRLLDTDMAKRVAGNPESWGASTTIRYKRESDPLIYSLKIEPDSQSDGRNLVVAVNGHQDIAPEQPVNLNQFAQFRKHVKEIHARIHDTIL